MAVGTASRKGTSLIRSAKAMGIHTRHVASNDEFQKFMTWSVKSETFVTVCIVKSL